MILLFTFGGIYEVVSGGTSGSIGTAPLSPTTTAIAGSEAGVPATISSPASPGAGAPTPAIGGQTAAPGTTTPLTGCYPRAFDAQATVSQLIRRFALPITPVPASAVTDPTAASSAPCSSVSFTDHRARGTTDLVSYQTDGAASVSAPGHDVRTAVVGHLVIHFAPALDSRLRASYLHDLVQLLSPPPAEPSTTVSAR